MYFKNYPEIEVIEIYPNPNKLEDYFETGSCHIRINNWKLEIANISYLISKDKKIVIRQPGFTYKHNGNKKFMNSINFSNNSEIWKLISKKIITEIKTLQPELFKHGKPRTRKFNKH